jgi:GTP-binding protein Era
MPEMPTSETPYRAGYVAIVGRANVGKSTLLNRLVGQKVSITSRKPQTTRHRVAGIVTGPKAQAVYVDTPGFQTGRRNALGASMNRVVTQSLAAVDVVLFVVEAGRYGPVDQAVARLLPADHPRIVVINKVDKLADKRVLLPFMEQLSQDTAATAIVPISAERGLNIAQLQAEIDKLLPEQDLLFPEEQVSDRDERFFAAEFLREKLFRLLGDEVPYGATVVIERFEETPTLRRIHAAVIVEKDSHKGIVIGEGGETMKRMASAARRDMEALFGGKVHLEVWVKVRSGWADNAAGLGALGYS